MPLRGLRGSARDAQKKAVTSALKTLGENRRSVPRKADTKRRIKIRGSAVLKLLDAGNRRAGHPKNAGDLGIVLSIETHLENHVALKL
jgi:hypothetical protein